MNRILSNGADGADVLLDASGVVALLGGTVTERWVRDAGASGFLPSIKLGKFMTSEQADAAALWALHTHVVDAFDYSPYLAISSPERRCGKTTLLDVLEGVCARPWKVITPSELWSFAKSNATRPRSSLRSGATGAPSP